jgi:hypothetical protein
MVFNFILKKLICYFFNLALIIFVVSTFNYFVNLFFHYNLTIQSKIIHPLIFLKKNLILYFF